jgi:DNA-binding HxlR family transcriptional regulator
MRKKSGPRRSSCPVSISLDILGDRWSLLIVRDLMVRGYRTFSEMEHDGDGIATNILSDRLRKLEAADILGTEPAPDRRGNAYRLSEKGIALGPVMLELLIWAARHLTPILPPFQPLPERRAKRPGRRRTAKRRRSAR